VWAVGTAALSRDLTDRAWGSPSAHGGVSLWQAGVELGRPRRAPLPATLARRVHLDRGAFLRSRLARPPSWIRPTCHRDLITMSPSLLSEGGTERDTARVVPLC